MPKYLCLQRALPKSEAGEPSPGQMQDWYAQFNAWREKFADNLDDLGGKLGDGRVATAQGQIDGPFVEVKELVGGYMIVSAPSLHEAVNIASACPGLVRPGSGCEVIEIETP